jgi:hypothetical protein
MTRKGKIARLPRLIRNELNRRLDDGEAGPSLLEWLNAHPDVVLSLARQHSPPITKQNLSEWHQGGYRDWLREQSTRAWLRDLADQSKNLRDDLGFVSFADWLAAPLTAALGRQLQRLASAPSDDPESTKELLALARGLAHLRHADHEQQRVRILRARHEEYFSEADEKDEDKEQDDDPPGMVPPAFKGD